MYSFADDGTVVRVADTSVTMSREDLTTWKLSRLQLETVLGALDALGVREAEPGSFGDATVRRYTPSGNVSWDTGRVIGGDDERLMETLYAVTEPPAHGVRRWTPTAIGFLAGRPDRTSRSPLTATDPFARWPLQRGIRELATGTAGNAYGEERLAVCVIGRDARPGLAAPVHRGEHGLPAGRRRPQVGAAVVGRAARLRRLRQPVLLPVAATVEGVRMFAALVPPEPVVEDLAEFLAPRQEAEPGFRWTVPEQWHVTLAFMGSVTDRILDDLVERLGRAAARRSPLDLTLVGGGAFPNPARAKVLFAAVDADGREADLRHLAVGARAAATKAGADAEGGRFHPHVTLARIGRPAEVTRWLRVLEGLPRADLAGDRGHPDRVAPGRGSAPATALRGGRVLPPGTGNARVTGA